MTITTVKAITLASINTSTRESTTVLVAPEIPTVANIVPSDPAAFIGQDLIACCHAVRHTDRDGLENGCAPLGRAVEFQMDFAYDARLNGGLLLQKDGGEFWDGVGS